MQHQEFEAQAQGHDLGESIHHEPVGLSVLERFLRAHVSRSERRERCINSKCLTTNSFTTSDYSCGTRTDTQTSRADSPDLQQRPYTATSRNRLAQGRGPAAVALLAISRGVEKLLHRNRPCISSLRKDMVRVSLPAGAFSGKECRVVKLLTRTTRNNQSI